MNLKRLGVFLATVTAVVGVSHIALHQPEQANAESLYNASVPHDAPIPTEAIRLRIIANSDSTADQNLKLEVRDAVVVKVAGYLKGVKTSTEARKVLLEHESDLNALAQQVVEEKGYHYNVSTDVAKVAFPTKIYGNEVYPAGTYEALRIIIGSGSGQNWWCVLFPPLCFVDIAEGDAVPNTGGFPDLPPLETIQVTGADGKPQKVQVRSAALDYGEELWRGIRQSFQSSEVHKK